jgi:hypothetical protein
MDQSTANQTHAIKSTIFRDVIREKSILLSANFWLVAYLAVYSSKMLMNFYQTTQHHIPEDSTLQSPL